MDGVFPSAKDMGVLGSERFANNYFEDVAYFEPYYLKDFVAGLKKKF
jgi:tRNA threonylcarbamoyladenosine biosynthesis protein TsaB